MGLFGISLISSTHSHTITNVRSTSSKVKKTTYHVFVGKSGFVSHTKHIAEATNMDIFYS